MANRNLKEVANRQVSKFHQKGFSREPFAAISTIRHSSSGIQGHDCSPATFATVTMVTPQAASPVFRLAVDKVTAVTAAATATASRLVGLLSDRDHRCLAATTATAAPGAVKIESFHTKRATATAATTGSALDDNQTKGSGPRPFEGVGFDKPDYS